MQQDIRLLNTYFRINKLALNIDKTKYVNFESQRARNEINASRTSTVDNNEYHESDSVKYLGLHIDKHLLWNAHIDHVNTKLAAATDIMRKLKFLPIDILRKLYFTLAHSHITYATSIWAAAKDNVLNKLQVMQRKALKACHKLSIRHSTHDLYTNIAPNILPIKAIRIQQTCEFVYCSLHRLIPSNMRFSKPSFNTSSSAYCGSIGLQPIRRTQHLAFRTKMLQRARYRATKPFQ